MENLPIWALPLGVFLPTIVLILLGIWAVRAVLRALEGISSRILDWHGSQVGWDAHDKMWKKFMESDDFRARLHEQIQARVESVAGTLNGRMDLLDKTMVAANAVLLGEVSAKLDRFRSDVTRDVIEALSKRLGESDRPNGH